MFVKMDGKWRDLGCRAWCELIIAVFAQDYPPCMNFEECVTLDLMLSGF